MKAYVFFGFFIGLVIGARLPQGFFRPWEDDGKFYGNEVVNHTPEGDGPFYSLCEGKVVYVYNQSHIFVKWSKCKDMADFFDIHNNKQLERK